MTTNALYDEIDRLRADLEEADGTIRILRRLLDSTQHSFEEAATSRDEWMQKCGVDRHDLARPLPPVPPEPELRRIFEEVNEVFRITGHRISACLAVQALAKKCEQLAQELVDEKAACVDCGDEYHDWVECLEKIVNDVKAERDEARKMFCEGWAAYGQHMHGNGEECSWNTARKVCMKAWPADADRLFPRAATGDGEKA